MDIVARSKRIPARPIPAGTLHFEWNPDIGDISRNNSHEAPLRYAADDEGLTAQKQVPANRLLRCAESVARKIVTEDSGPLALAEASISLDKKPAGRRDNTKDAKVVVGNQL